MFRLRCSLQQISRYKERFSSRNYLDTMYQQRTRSQQPTYSQGGSRLKASTNRLKCQAILELSKKLQQFRLMFNSELLQHKPLLWIKETGKGARVVYSNSTRENVPRENIPREATIDAREKVSIRRVSVLDLSSFLSPNASLRVFRSVLAFLLQPISARTIALQAQFISASIVIVNVDIVVGTIGRTIRITSLY